MQLENASGMTIRGGPSARGDHVWRIARALAETLSHYAPGSPVAHVYHPLMYAHEPAAAYFRRYATGQGVTLLLGMNPGPFGMAQTGVPFGDVEMVRDFLRIEGRVTTPAHTHSKRPVAGFRCTRREVSGTRLWGFVVANFTSVAAFFSRYFVYNYCPLAFLTESGKNVTPAMLKSRALSALYAACDDTLRALCRAMQVKMVLGIGGFAAARAKAALAGDFPEIRIATLCHPSPASPKANTGWQKIARSTFHELCLPFS